MKLELDSREYNRKVYKKEYEAIELRLEGLRHFKGELQRIYCELTGSCAKSIELTDDCVIEHITQNYILCIMFEEESDLCKNKKEQIEKVLKMNKEVDEL